MSRADDVRQQYSAVLGYLERIGHHYFINGQFANGLSVLEHGLNLFGATSVPDAYTQLHLTYGHVLLWQSSLLTGDYTHPITVLEDAVQQAEAIGNAALLARAYDELGFCLYQRALTSVHISESAAQYFERALAVWERLGDTAGICTARFHIGLAAERANQFEAAVDQFHWVHTTARDHTLHAQQADASRHLGFAAVRAGDYSQALHAFQEALSLLEAQGSELFLPFAYLSVGEVYQIQGNYAEAHHYYTHAAQKAAALGVKRASVQILFCLGEVAEEQAQRQSADAYYSQAHQIAHSIQFQLGIQMTAAKLAQLRATE